MTKKKAVVVKEELSPAVVAQMAEDVCEFDLDPADLQMPKLLLGQSMSKLVQDEEITFGEIYKNTTSKAVGGKGNPVEVIPLSMNKNWIISKKVKGRFEFAGYEDFVPNTRLDWNYEKDGVEMKREQSLNVYVLLKSDLDAYLAGESTELLLPTLLNFKSTSFKQGKMFVNAAAMASQMKKPLYSFSYMIDSQKVTGDQAYYVYAVKPGAKVDPKYYELASDMLKMARTATVQAPAPEPEVVVQEESLPF